jgi:FkbM family methyltransferase
VAQGWRRPVLQAAQRANAEPALRGVQRFLVGSTRRREFRDRDHLRLLIRLALSTNANCVDVGANIGDVLTEIVAIAPEGRHVAFEPLPELAADLQRRFPQVDVRNAAVSDVSGRAPFYRMKASHTRSSLSRDGLDASEIEPIQVSLETLDDALPTGYVPTLVKIDVEGAEAGVLRGARRLLGDHRPIVVFEHGEAAPRAATREIYGLLASLGYRLFDIDANGPLTRDDFNHAVRDGRLWTYVAHP